MCVSLSSIYTPNVIEMMPRKSWVEVMEEALRRFPPGSVVSWECLEQAVRANTHLWQRFKIRELLKTLQARRVFEPDPERPGMYVMWPDKVGENDTRL